MFFFFFKQKTAYEMRISDWSSDVCSSDLKIAVDIGVAQRVRYYPRDFRFGRAVGDFQYIRARNQFRISMRDDRSSQPTPEIGSSLDRQFGEFRLQFGIARQAQFIDHLSCDAIVPDQLGLDRNSVG